MLGRRSGSRVGAGGPWNPELVVLGDESQLNRVLSNLMSNARKHTSDGTRVTVSVGLTPSRDAALLRVVDNGEGIDPEFVDRIFDRFARADARASGSTPPPGLVCPSSRPSWRRTAARSRCASCPARPSSASACLGPCQRSLTLEGAHAASGTPLPEAPHRTCGGLGRPRTPALPLGEQCANWHLALTVRVTATLSTVAA